MAAINEHLARIYHHLTGDQGTASCSFTDDPTLLFLDGVSLNVRRGPLACADRHVAMLVLTQDAATSCSSAKVFIHAWCSVNILNARYILNGYDAND